MRTKPRASSLVSTPCTTYNVLMARPCDYKPGCSGLLQGSQARVQLGAMSVLRHVSGLLAQHCQHQHHVA